MYSISLSIDRLRHLLQEIDENNLDHRLHPARDVPGLAPTDEDTPAQEHKEKAESRAETASKKVVSTAKEGAGDADRVYRNIETPDFSMSDFDKPDVQACMREFERGFRQFRGAVRKALDECLNGNTLVMDLILKLSAGQAGGPTRFQRRRLHDRDGYPADDEGRGRG